MNIRPRFRTILALLLFVAVALAGGAISLTTYATMIVNMRNFTDGIAFEISAGSKANIESVQNYSERGIRLIATVFSKRIHDPMLPLAARDIWRQFSSTTFKNNALNFVDTKNGSGFIIQGESLELVAPDGRGGFVATSASTGERRPVTDMRTFDWYRFATDPDAHSDTGWTVVRHFANNLRDISGQQGFSLYQAIRSDPLSKRVDGVISISVSVGWARDRLLEAIGRHGINAMVAFMISDDGNGQSPLLLAHTDDLVNAKLSSSATPIPPSECGDEVTRIAANDYLSVPLDDGLPHSRKIQLLGETYHATFTNLKPGDPPRWILCQVIKDSEIINPARRRLFANLGITLGILAVLLTPAIWFSLRVASPIERLTAVAEATGRLDLSANPRVSSGIREIHQLAQAVESMRSGLKSFLRYIPEDLLRRYLNPSDSAGLDSEVIPVSVMFSDIRDFSTHAERSEPLMLVRQLNDYFETVSTVISLHRGTVDKYIGDAVMSFWNAPNRVPAHARESCAAALDIQKTLAEARRRWHGQGLPSLHTRIGIHTGEVIVGNIGSSVRLNYTIIGDAVNLASRLESLNKQYSTSILISEPARMEAGGEFLTRPIDLIAVKGKKDPVLVHELMGWRSECPQVDIERAEFTLKAFQAYKSRDFAAAADAYSAIAERWEDDRVARIMFLRAAELRDNPPPDNWSGIHRATSK